MSHAFSPNTWEAEAEVSQISVNLSPAWTTQPGLPEV